MIPSNFEARQLGEGRSHVEALAAWCGGMVHDGDSRLPPVILAPVNGGVRMASPGDWIIRQPDGTFRVDRPGSQDGYCADCGTLVWRNVNALIDSSGNRWCFGAEDAQRLARWHALPGMHQYVVQAADGQVCRCLARSELHIHQIVLLDPAGAGGLAEAPRGTGPYDPARYADTTGPGRPGYHGEGELADFGPDTGRSSWDDWSR
jgi:hypothetical protein